MFICGDKSLKRGKKMNVSIELAALLNGAGHTGHSGIIRKLNCGEELTQSELLSVFNALAKKIEKIEKEANK